MADTDSTSVLLRQFSLTSLIGRLDEFEDRAQRDNWTFQQYLRELLESEASVRSERRLKRLLKEAALPEGKTLASLPSTPRACPRPTPST